MLDDYIVDKFEIPKIEKTRLDDLMKQIRPMGLKEVKDGLFQLTYLEPLDPIKESFAFGQKWLKPAKKLYLMTQYIGFTSSYPSFFKPSMEEVFAYIQDYSRIDEVKAFRVEFAGHHPSGEGNRMVIYMYGD